MIKVAIVGSRNYFDCDYIKSKFTEVLSFEGIDIINVVIVSGGAKGVDTCAQMIAKEFGLPILIIYPDWKSNGKMAGILRNTAIAKNSDIVIAFPSKDSKGTWDTINKAKQLRKKLYIFNVED